MKSFSTTIKVLQTKFAALGIWPAVAAAAVVVSAVVYDYLTLDFDQWEGVPEVVAELKQETAAIVAPTAAPAPKVKPKATYEEALTGKYDAARNRVSFFEPDDKMGNQVFGFYKTYMLNPHEQKRHTAHTTAKQGMKMMEISFEGMSEEGQIEFRKICLAYSDKKETCPEIPERKS